jgi:hypothetical protein
MWEPQPLTTLRASKACRGENFTFTLNDFIMKGKMVLVIKDPSVQSLPLSKIIGRT